MKKITLFLLLISSLYADAQLYLGLSHGYYDESYTNVDAQSANTVSTFKVGYGDKKAYAVEFSVESLKNTAKIFSQNDSNKDAMDINLIKSLDLDLAVIPYFKIGMGAGVFNVEGQFQSRLHYGSFNLGLGILIPVYEDVDLELSFTQKYISYEGIDTISEDVSYTSTMNITTFGFNVRF